MSSDRQIFTLGDVADVSWGDTSTTKKSYSSSGFDAYSASGRDGLLPYFDYDRTGVVISAIGAECGKTWLAKGKWSCIKNTIRMWSASPLLDTEYLYWISLRQNFFPIRGSAQPFISQGDARGIEIECPPIHQQKAIAHILGTLDDKIELNRKTNETLEEIAKALFKSWFVDFDPVRAKVEGRPTGLPSEISDLFPDSFEDSELGEIPSGWRVDSIYAVASVIYGAPFSSSLFNGDGDGIPVARIRDLPGETPGVFTTEVHSKGTRILPGDIVVGMDGEFRAYLWGGEECWMNQRVCKFIPIEKSRTCFLRESIHKPLMDVERSETATTVIHLGKGDIDRFRLVVPSPDILGIFSLATTPLYEEVVAKKQQTRVLANIRDALLPKLISGEIRIPDAEKMLEEVGV